MTDHGSRIEFRVEDIHQIATSTRAHQAEWDNIWNTVKTRLSGVVSQALDAATGSSLEERSAEYHRKTQVYNQQLQAQQHAVGRVGDIAEETNVSMQNTIRKH
ncbi:hypothetical protein ACFWY9_04110 [Amycolatopsis sp. NPDC059027]|uniref:hypothetical protein n=1 Tax=unclassified Amycolatopsis TaxID=2618356 RepID=UPI0036725CBE